MGKDEDVEKSLTTGKKEKKETKRSTSTKQPKNYETLSCVLGMLTAVVILAIVTVIAISVYEKEKKDGCGPFSYPGVNISTLTPKVLSQEMSCNIAGNCWTGEQCYKCFELENWEVGNINDIPVCCPECELSGLSLSNNSCSCQKTSRDIVT